MPTNNSYWEDTSNYWANANAEFEKTNPSLLARMGRSVNPVTSFGSSMGMMKDSADSGDKLGMLLAGLSSIPTFAAYKAFNPLAKSKAIDLNHLLSRGILNTGTGVAADLYQPTYQSTNK